MTDSSLSRRGLLGAAAGSAAAVASGAVVPAAAGPRKHHPRRSTADLVLFGEAVSRGGTVGFAWEFGSHGGLTRTETNSAICWPSSAPVDLSGLSHCVDLHERLSEVYRDEARPPRPMRLEGLGAEPMMAEGPKPFRRRSAMGSPVLSDTPNSNRNIPRMCLANCSFSGLS